MHKPNKCSGPGFGGPGPVGPRASREPFLIAAWGRITFAQVLNGESLFKSEMHLTNLPTMEMNANPTHLPVLLGYQKKNDIAIISF